MIATKIRIHWSVVFLAIIFYLVGATRYSIVTGLPFFAPDSILVGVIVAIGAFLSVFLHELFHYIAARKIGLEVENLSINFLGGYVKTDTKDVTDPKEYVLLAGAGLLATVLIIISLLWISFATSPSLMFSLLVIVELNILLLILNALPIFPLDGWRLLFGFAWMVRDKKTGERFAHIVSIPTGILVAIVSWIIMNSFLLVLSAFSVIASALFVLDGYKLGKIFGKKILALTKFYLLPEEADEMNEMIKKLTKTNPPFFKKDRDINSIAMAMYFLRSHNHKEEMSYLDEFANDVMPSISMDDVYGKVDRIEAWCKVNLQSD